MDTINIRKYLPRNSILKNLIKYYWIIRTSKETIIDNKLFPSNNIDFIINLSSPITYTDICKTESFERFHFRGIRNSCQVIQQSGILDVVGISFFSTGVYPILKIPLYEFTNKTVLLEDLIKDFDSRFDSLWKYDSDNERINEIEKILLQLIDLSILPGKEHSNFIHKTLNMDSKIYIKEYCSQIGVNQKTFERSFKKFVGINPKSFIKLTRFQTAINQLIDGKNSNLTTLTYKMGYFDQTHFVKDFKSYMQTTPLEFVKQKNSVKELLEYG